MATIIDLACTEDTYCSAENPNTNYGTATVLNAGGYIGDSQPGKYSRFYALMKFNLAAMPVRKKVLDIKVRVRSAKAMSATSDSRVVYSRNVVQISGNPIWGESTATYNTTGDRSGGSLAFEGQVLTANTYYEFGNFVTNPIGEYGIYFYWVNTSTTPWSTDYWQVYSRESSYPPVLRVTYEDVPPDAPTPIDPIGVYKDNTAIVRFNWQYNSSVGGVQKKFDLQWSSNNGSSWTTVSATTPNNYRDVAANTFPSGNILWRVRCYNEYDEVSAYSSISTFYAIGAAATPTIQTITTDTARPIISWGASAQQQIYQIQILRDSAIIHDSGALPGILARSYKVPVFLQDDNYAVQVRIKNEYDLWSAWGQSVFTVTTTKPDAPTYTLQRSRYGVELHITAVTGAAYYLIYRADYPGEDYTCVGILPDSLIFADNTGANKKEYKYFIRAVTEAEAEAYRDSTAMLGNAEFSNSLISPVSDMGQVYELVFGLNSPAKKAYTRNTNATEVYYSGRQYPVSEPSEHTGAVLNLSFLIRDYAALESLIALYDLKGTVLYRDSRGRRMYGVMSGLAVSDERKKTGYSISFTITQVDYIEELEV